MRFSFCFLGSGAQHQQTRTKTKKRWGPALWLWKGLVALARAKLRKQQLKIRPHKEKKNYQSQHETHIADATHKAANKKSRMQKKKQQTRYPIQQTKQSKSIYPVCGIDRKQPTACGRLCIGQPPTGGERSLDCRYPQNMAFHLVCGFA